MLRKILTTATALCILVSIISAQTVTDTTTMVTIKETKTDTTVPETNTWPTITGSLDVYYRYNFSDPKSGTLNNFTSFTNSQNTFQLGMASVKVDQSLGKASATVDLGFGTRAEEFSYGDPSHSTLFAVKQAYLSYAVSEKFKLTMGKWATHVGYEL
ncbi:MAG: outer membrane beta-barrel protein, partial [Ginsengibacter sp.]